MVEYVPVYDGLPVYSGYVRVYFSERGVVRVVQHWVEPVGFKEGAPKAVRPAAEALLRLAGHLEQESKHVRTIVDVRLGYYSGPSVTVSAAGEISAWETVPVWRITLDNGLVYYVNAFNGELES
nr:two-component system regulatory protein YycI [Symbiobacterium terraclitae]